MTGRPYRGMLTLDPYIPEIRIESPVLLGPFDTHSAYIAHSITGTSVIFIDLYTVYLHPYSDSPVHLDESFTLVSDFWGVPESVPFALC